MFFDIVKHLMSIKGTLYICPTPIGNLEDITLRVLRVLKEVDFIACEDTRVTQKLLNRYEINTKLISYHKFSEKEKSNYIVQLLNEGKSIALVSDAGTPLISDPGIELLKHDINVIPLPGPSSVITALSATPRNGTDFVFIGFLPKTKKAKEDFLRKYSDIDIVAFESPNRLVKSLQEILEVLGNRKVTIARELTKIYEEIKTDLIDNLIAYYSQNPPKGEIVLIIHGMEEKKPEQKEIIEKALLLKKEGYSSKDISKIISLLYQYPKKEVYNIVLNLIGV